MKKIGAVIFVLAFMLILTQSAFADSDGADEKPVVMIKGDYSAYIDDYFTRGIYIDKIDDLEYAEIVVHYNPEVLEFVRFIRATDDVIHTHYVSVSENGSGELLVRIRKEYDNGCRGENEALEFLDFYAKRNGKTGLTAEVKEAVCSNGGSIDLEAFWLPEETEVSRMAEPYINFDFYKTKENFEGVGNESIYNKVYELNIDTRCAGLFQDVSILLQYDPEVIRFSKKAELQPGFSIEFLEEGKLIVHYKVSENPEYVFFREPQKLPYIILGGSTKIIFTITNNDSLYGAPINGNLNPVYIEADPIEISYKAEDAVLTVSGAGPIVGTFDDYFENKTSHLCESPESIEEVYIEKGITGIGAGVFTDYSNMKAIHIPNSVEFIEKGAIPADAVIHADSMSLSERYATIYGNPFVLPENVLIGDVRKDGNLTADDALYVLYMAAKVSPEYRFTADITGDGIVDASDALKILKIAAKLL